jgi:WD40 repeat protein
MQAQQQLRGMKQHPLSLPRQLSRRTFLTCMLASLATGCAAGAQSPPARSPSPTVSPTATASPTPTATPAPRLLPITPENAGQVTQLAAFDAAGPVKSVAWSPDGWLLAGGATDIEIWDTRAGRQLAALQGGDGLVYGLAWSPDGQMVAAASTGGVQVWDVMQQKQHAYLKGDPPQAQTGTLGVAWSPDGSKLLSGNTDGMVQVWNARTGAQLARLLGHPLEVPSSPNSPPAVFGVSWSPDRQHFASSREDGVVQVWDAQTYHLFTVLHTPPGSFGFNEIAYSPDGRMLAASSDEGTVRIWDLVSGTTRRVLNEYGQYGWSNAVSWSPDGKMLITSCAGGTALILDVTTGQSLTALAVASSGRVNVWGAAWSPNGRLIATGDDQRTVRVWGIT